MKRHNIISIVVLAIAAAFAAVIIGGIPWHPAKAPIAENGQGSGSHPGTGVVATSSAPRISPPMPILPKGPVTYQIAEAASMLPGFVQATIDPLDVSLHETQHFKVITKDPNPITSVVATIHTDHGTITVPLTSQGPAPISLLVPQRYHIDANNEIALGPPPQAQGNGNVANAADAQETLFTGQWVVRDTHTAKYQTTFTATDSAGNTNSVTLDWTDPTCSFTAGTGYTSGSVTQSSNCTVSGVDGPETGDLTIGSGATITLNGTLAIGSGHQISISSGAIAIPSTGYNIQLGVDMCGTDSDGDGYIAGSTWATSTSCGGGMVSRASLTGTVGFSDCDDSDANAHPGQTQYFSTISHGGTWDYNCDGTVTKAITAVGSPSATGGCGGSANSCQSNDSSVNGQWSSGAPACGATGNYWQTVGIQCTLYPSYWTCPTENSGPTRTQSCL